MTRPKVMLVGQIALAGDEAAEHLRRRGYDVRELRETWEARSVLAGEGADVAVVGISEDGALDLLRENAAGATSFIMSAAGNGDLVDRVLALEMGAADVVECSISPRELAARIAGLVTRRSAGTRAELIQLERSTVDLRAALVMHRSGDEDLLSPGQIALLKLFAANPHAVLTRDDIIAAAPAETADAFDRSIDSRIVRLRRKLDTESIATVRGAGYRFDPPY